MKTVISWCVLISGMLLTVSAQAQLFDSAVESENIAKVTPTAAPCYRAYCHDFALLVEQPAAEVAPAKPSKASRQRSAESEWKEHMTVRAHGDEYNCLLSVGFGGELRSNGYQGIRLFGQARTLNLAGGKAAR